MSKPYNLSPEALIGLGTLYSGCVCVPRDAAEELERAGLVIVEKHPPYLAHEGRFYTLLANGSPTEIAAIEAKIDTFQKFPRVALTDAAREYIARMRGL